MAKLVIEAEDGGRRELELTTRPVRIGRASENDLALPDPNKGVSRMHAELRYEDGRYVILDLNSQNGTWIDGNRVQRADLASGSQIVIGPYLLTLEGADSRPILGDAASNEPAGVVAHAAEPPVAVVEPPTEREIRATEDEVKAIVPEVNARELKSETAELEIMVAELKVMVAEPEVKAVQPEVKAAEPEVKAVEPEAKAVEPEVKAAEPEVKAAEPEVKAAEPDAKITGYGIKAAEPEEQAVAPKVHAQTPSADTEITIYGPPAIAKQTPAVAAKAATSDAHEEGAAATEPVAKPRPVKEAKPFPIEELPLRLDEPPPPSDEAPSLLIKPSAPAAAPRAIRPTPSSAAVPTQKKETPPKRPVRPPVIAPVEPEPGAFARFGKPVLLVMLIAIALAIAVGQRYLFAPAPPAATVAPPPAPETNAQAIERHLAEGKALVEKKEYEAAIRDHFDRILLIDPAHAEATELRTKAQEALQAQTATTPTDTAAVPPANSTPPTSPAPGASAPQPQTPTATAPAAPPKPVAAAPSTPPPDRGATTPRGATPDTSRGTGRAAENLPSPRRQNETAQAWRARNAELQAQYNTAKTALDRRQYSAAVNGFEAVVKGEPNFLDAPQLLAKARAELKVTGPEALAAANKADAAGNWTVAVEQFQRARQLDSSLAPQADEGVRRVREKMRTAGAEAFKRARQLDALGRSADAIKEYENAAQWLPADDANRTVARQRADQLKTGLK